MHSSNQIPEKVSFITFILLMMLFVTTIATSPSEDYDEDNLPYDQGIPNTDNIDMFATPSMDGDTNSELDMSTRLATPEAPTEIVESCENFGSISCFANSDCAEDARCSNVGDDTNLIACCVLGERGTVQAGEACDVVTGQEECASSLCVAYGERPNAFCSGECLSDDDCPETLPSCISVAFSGSDLMWCFPDSN